MYRYILIGFFFVFSCNLFAQEGTTSPYSHYGIGSLKFKGTVENRAMGGLGVFSDSIHLNLQNPAAYSNIRLVTLTAGMSHLVNQQETSEISQTAQTTSLDYFAIGFPVGKLGFGFGVLPYSSVGYNFFSKEAGQVSEYSGKGGLNKTFLSLGYEIIPGLSIGIDGQYNFGQIENKTISKKDNMQYGIRTIENSKLGGFSVNFGAMYKTMITENLELSGAVSYMPGMDLTSKNTREIATINIRPTGIQTIDKREISVPDTDFTSPNQFTFGLAVSKPRHWGIGAEYSNQDWSKVNEENLNSAQASYGNASFFRLGGFYIPEYNSFTNYFKRVTYRAGGRYEQTGLSFNGENINEFGISFGLGMPIGRLFSNINLGIEFGSRGTKNSGLIQENFFNTFLSFSLNDRWFEKRLYN